jgi:hypothetical protein
MAGAVPAPAPSTYGTSYVTAVHISGAGLWPYDAAKEKGTIDAIANLLQVGPGPQIPSVPASYYCLVDGTAQYNRDNRSAVTTRTSDYLSFHKAAPDCVEGGAASKVMDSLPKTRTSWDSHPFFGSPHRPMWRHMIHTYLTIMYEWGEHVSPF